MASGAAQSDTPLLVPPFLHTSCCFRYRSGWDYPFSIVSASMNAFTNKKPRASARVLMSLLACMPFALTLYSKVRTPSSSVLCCQSPVPSPRKKKINIGNFASTFKGAAPDPLRGSGSLKGRSVGFNYVNMPVIRNILAGIQTIIPAHCKYQVDVTLKSTLNST